MYSHSGVSHDIHDKLQARKLIAYHDQVVTSEDSNAVKSSESQKTKLKTAGEAHTMTLEQHSAATAVDRLGLPDPSHDLCIRLEPGCTLLGVHSLGCSHLDFGEAAVVRFDHSDAKVLEAARRG